MLRRDGNLIVAALRLNRGELRKPDVLRRSTFEPLLKFSCPGGPAKPQGSIKLSPVRGARCLLLLSTDDLLLQRLHLNVPPPEFGFPFLQPLPRLTTSDNADA